VSYYHVTNIAETIRYLEKNYPWYIHDCPVRNIRFSMVPQEYVAHYYDPQERLNEIMANPQDSLEEEARGLITEITTCAGISLADLGITGSILLGLHNLTFSDINLLVYGLDKAEKVRAALRERKCDRISPLNTAIIERWNQEMLDWFPVNEAEGQYAVERRWNYGLYGDRFFGIHPTRTDQEITEQYGQHIYRSGGPVHIRAIAADVREAIFQPAVYRVEDVQILDGPSEAQAITQIVSYEGRFRDMVEAGQSLEALGKLETVDGHPQQLVVGTTQLAGQEYIKPG